MSDARECNTVAARNMTLTWRIAIRTSGYSSLSRRKYSAYQSAFRSEPSTTTFLPIDNAYLDSTSLQYLLSTSTD